MTKAGQAIINARIANQMYPYPIPPTVRTRTLGFDWQMVPFQTGTLANNASILVPNGHWIQRAYGQTEHIQLQMYDDDASSWNVIWAATAASWTAVSAISDGTNLRFQNAGAGANRIYSYVAIQKKSGRI